MAEAAPANAPKTGRSTTTDPNPMLAKGALTFDQATDAFEKLLGGGAGGEGGDEAPPPPGAIEGDEAPEIEDESSEAEEEEAPAEEESEGEPQVEPEAPEVEPEAFMVPITVEGQVKEVPLADLQRSYLQQADYTKKTQALADERRTHETQVAAWTDETTRLNAQLDDLMPVLIGHFNSTQKTP